MGHVRVSDAVRFVGETIVTARFVTNTDHSPSELYPNFVILPFRNSVTYTAGAAVFERTHRRIAYLL